ncbi:MAG: DUF1524 domain-containing protein, partial [Acidobacteriota bacterium]|nr:DUF1524 domain-containing protein [Acidobacteriota bacterium]
IPIAYYLLKNGSPHNFVYASEFKEDRRQIQKWLVASLLKRAFSGTPDNVLRPIRQVIDKGDGGFPLEQIVDEFRGKPKSITFNSDEIQNLFLYYYGSPYTFSTLAVLYPTLDFRNRFHLDHIHPRSSFKKRNLLKRGIPESKIGFYLDEVDYIANLQLLEGPENTEKRDDDFKDWLDKTCPNPQARRDFMAKHYIPDVDLSLSNFEQFVEERKKLMAAKFENLLRM